MYISISKNWRRAWRFLILLGRFSQFFSGLQNGTRKATQTGRRRSPENNEKSIAWTFFPLAAPLEEQVWKKCWRRSGQSPPEPRYMVFCRDRTSLFDFSLWPWKHRKIRLLSCPLAPQTHPFSVKVQKKKVWEQSEKSLKIASAKNPKSDTKVRQNGGPNPGQI